MRSHGWSRCAIGAECVVLCITTLWPDTSVAQGVAASRAAVSAPVTSGSSIRARGPSLLMATLASATLPGAGQALLHSRRAIAYVGAEVVGLSVYVVQTRNGDRQRARYRDLSRTVARAHFMPGGPAGNWDYYERMEKFAASGAYDANPGGAIDPESDPATYNGSIWLLARQTYWRDPNTAPAPTSTEFQASLAFYTKRAVPPELQWSWAGSTDGFQEYRRSIAGSNSAFRRAEQTAGLVIANHILSAVDAFVSVRLRARHSPDGRTSLTAGIPFGSSR
jgi:hypothetical protein